MNIPQEVQAAFDAFSRNANKGDVGTHPYDEDRFYAAVQVAYEHNTDMEFPEFDALLTAQGWMNSASRKELAQRFSSAYKMLAYERTGSTFGRNS